MGSWKSNICMPPWHRLVSKKTTTNKRKPTNFMYVNISVRSNYCKKYLPVQKAQITYSCLSLTIESFNNFILQGALIPLFRCMKKMVKTADFPEYLCVVINWTSIKTKQTKNEPCVMM